MKSKNEIISDETLLFRLENSQKMKQRTLSLLFAIGMNLLGAIAVPKFAQADEPNYVLAISWQPGFCETRPNLPECESQTGDRFDATHFSIHGLWPQPRNNIYCNVSRAIEQTDRDGRWLDLPALDLSASTRRELQIKMPGYESGLHRHEWYKHGTCYSATPEEYYRETIALLDRLNASPVRTLFAQNLENDITDDRVIQAFDREFGAGSKVSMRCKSVDGENLIYELRINLRGEIDEDSDITDLLWAAPNARSGCSLGQVDSVDE